MKGKAKRLFAARLLDWYSREGRHLPWRRTRDPYRILVSEIMLQQTQVARVQEYYGRFLKAFPNLRTLAHAPLERVLKLWEGMGYYARARNLQAAARTILREHGGKVPSRLEILQTLPGVGYNTAASVASLAYGRSWPVLDGNAMRVLCRVFRLVLNPRTAVGHKRLLNLAVRLLPPNAVGSFNQGLMDLGALICRPATPLCSQCPLEDICSGHASGHPEKYPGVKPRARRPHYDITAGIIWRGRRLLIAQRLPGALLGGLWEFPGGKQEDGETLPECLRREIREELDIEVRVDEPFMRLEHGYSHFQFTLHVFDCTYLRGTPRPLGCADFRWVRITDLVNYALPRADQKVAAALELKGGR